MTPEIEELRRRKDNEDRIIIPRLKPTTASTLDLAVRAVLALSDEVEGLRAVVEELSNRVLDVEGDHIPLPDFHRDQCEGAGHDHE